jgi:hypothetical protein
MNSGQNVGIYGNNLDFKRLIVGRTAEDDTQMNINKSSCITFTCQPEDRKGQPEFRLSQIYQSN